MVEKEIKEGVIEALKNEGFTLNKKQMSFLNEEYKKLEEIISYKIYDDLSIDGFKRNILAFVSELYTRVRLIIAL